MASVPLAQTSRSSSRSSTASRRLTPSGGSRRMMESGSSPGKANVLQYGQQRSGPPARLQDQRAEPVRTRSGVAAALFPPRGGELRLDSRPGRRRDGVPRRPVKCRVRVNAWRSASAPRPLPMTPATACILRLVRCAVRSPNRLKIFSRGGCRDFFRFLRLFGTSYRKMPSAHDHFD